MKKREGYYRLKDSNVWHFEERCEHWPPKTHTEFVVNRVKRPSYGVLCDYCQAIEKKRGA